MLWRGSHRPGVQSSLHHWPTLSKCHLASLASVSSSAYWGKNFICLTGYVRRMTLWECIMSPEAVWLYGHISNFFEGESFPGLWDFPYHEEMKYNCELDEFNLPIHEHTKYYHCKSPIFLSHNVWLEQNSKTLTALSTHFVETREVKWLAQGHMLS